MSGSMSTKVFPLARSTSVGNAEARRISESAAIEKERHHRLVLLLGIYTAGALVASILTLTGAIASAWYTFNDSTEQGQSTGDDSVEYVQSWGMATAGVVVFTEYCSAEVGCQTSKDIFIFFDREANEDFDWPPSYSSAVESAHSGGQALLILTILFTIMQVGCVIAALTGLCRQLAKWTIITIIVTHTTASLLATLGVFLFYASVQDVLTLMQNESPIQNTAPRMALGWGAFLSFAGPAIAFGLLVPLIMASGPLSGDAKISLSDKVSKERQERIKNYRDDLTATSYEAEHRPVDTAPRGTKGVGWTRGVHTVPVNIVVQVDQEGKVMNQPNEVIVNEFSRSKSKLPGGRVDMSHLIPSHGATTKTLTPIEFLKPERFDNNDIPGIGTLSRTPSSLKRTPSSLETLQRTPSSLETLQRTPSSLSVATERTRAITRAPSNLDYRPRIEGFVSPDGERDDPGREGRQITRVGGTKVKIANN